MSKTLRGVEEWTPPILFHWLENTGLVQDNQSRYFVRADELSAETVIDVLSRLNLVRVTERIDQFVRQFQDLTGTIPSSRSLPPPRENRNPLIGYHCHCWMIRLSARICPSTTVSTWRCTTRREAPGT